MAADEDIVAPTTQFSTKEPYEDYPAGGLTHQKKINQDAFSHASANMSFERELDFKIGNAFFKRIWVSSPSTTQSSDGLGPLFNARSCQRCHIKDGRGHPPENQIDNNVSALLKLAIPPQNTEQQQLLASGMAANFPDPNYGSQLQDFSVQGVFAEGKMALSYEQKKIKMADGEVIFLRKPVYTVKNKRYGEFHRHIMSSLRVAPQMIGLGLLEAITEQDILAKEDVDDRNQDGISGKANRVWDITKQRTSIGRFGYKAGQPNLNQQNQAAFNNDIGIGTPLFPNPYGDCTKFQRDCLSLPDGNSGNDENLEVGTLVAEKVLHYSRNLAVPERRDAGNAEVLAGKKLFYESGCISCHTPKYITPRATQAPEQSRQLIWPYTDMLVHDMGDGLADGLTEGRANGREWKTAPLWGVGLTPVVNGHSFYLHDGRARNLLEAILWHGGEAKQSQQRVINMNKKQRQQLIRFVKSL
ncbi:MAG: di-heme oxidoredictase family protein [Arenicella sp.]